MWEVGRPYSQAAGRMLPRRLASQWRLPENLVRPCMTCRAVKAGKTIDRTICSNPRRRLGRNSRCIAVYHRPPVSIAHRCKQAQGLLLTSDITITHQCILGRHFRGRRSPQAWLLHLRADEERELTSKYATSEESAGDLLTATLRSVVSVMPMPVPQLQII